MGGSQAAAAGPRLGMHWAHRHSARSNSFSPSGPGQHCHVPVTQTKEKEQPARGGGQQNPGWNKAGSTRAQAATKGLAHTKPATTVASSLTRHPQPPNPPTVPTSEAA